MVEDPKSPNAINTYECRFLILFIVNIVVEPSSGSQKQNKISLLSQAFTSKPNMAFSSAWENA